MAVTEQQFNYLSTMGISLWQPRAGFYKDSIVQPATVNNAINKVSATVQPATVNNAINKVSATVQPAAVNNAINKVSATVQPAAVNNAIDKVSATAQPAAVNNAIDKVSATAQPASEVISATQITSTNQVKAIYSPEQLADNVLLQDILLILDINQAAISATDSALKLADISWQFHDNDECSLQDKQLLTPKLERIAAEFKIKQQLWTLLCNNQQQLTLNSVTNSITPTVEIK